MAPRIDRKNLQQKKVRVGHFLKIEADITGEPPPTVTWTFAGKTIGKSDRYAHSNFYQFLCCDKLFYQNFFLRVGGGGSNETAYHVSKSFKIAVNMEEVGRVNNIN